MLMEVIYHPETMRFSVQLKQTAQPTQTTQTNNTKRSWFQFVTSMVKYFFVRNATSLQCEPSLTSNILTSGSNEISAISSELSTLATTATLAAAATELFTSTLTPGPASRTHPQPLLPHELLPIAKLDTLNDVEIVNDTNDKKIKALNEFASVLNEYELAYIDPFQQHDHNCYQMFYKDYTDNELSTEASKIDESYTHICQNITYMVYHKKEDAFHVSFIQDVQTELKQLSYTFVFPVPNVDFFMRCASFCITSDMTKNLSLILKLLKLVRDDTHDPEMMEQSIKFIYEECIFDIDSMEPIEKMYKKFVDYNIDQDAFCLNILIDLRVFVDVLKSLNINIINGKVQYFKLKEGAKDKKDTLKMALSGAYYNQPIVTRFNKIQSQELRSTPECRPRNVSVWGQSSWALPPK